MEGGDGEGTRGGRERRGRDRVRGGREEARMLHRHEASVGEGRKERGEAWAAGGRKRAGEGLREETMEQGSKEMKLQGGYPEEEEEEEEECLF